ncbi:MAG: hypothetical protein Q7V62_17045 [Actinomycetota bacterium]|nr:hypothetical protein [Actinomycetota bacterium]
MSCLCRSPEVESLPRLHRRGYDAALAAFVTGCEVLLDGASMRVVSSARRFDKVCLREPIAGFVHIFAMVDRVSGDVHRPVSPVLGGVHAHVAGNLFDVAGGLANVTAHGPARK